MADEQVVTTEQEQVQTQPTLSERLQESVFGKDANAGGEQQQDQEKKKEEVDTQSSTIKEVEVPLDWLKKEFEIEDPAILKAEREELKTLKANPQKEQIKFADEQSKHIYELLSQGAEKRKEVLQVLKNQEEIENLSGLEVNKDNAADIIKLQMKLKNKQLTASEIEFEYKQSFVAPKEPVQKSSELDDDFEERVAEWKEKVSEVEMRRIIAAKMAQPELAQLKSEIVLPEIQRDNQSTEKAPTPEELAAFENDKKSFVTSAEGLINGFNGISGQVKDKDVDYLVNYAISPEGKTLVASKLKEFAESGFNANALFTDLWLDDNNNLKVDQMVEDLSLLFEGKKAIPKLVNDAANKRIETYLKDKKQINLKETNETGKLNLEKAGKDTMDNLREAMLQI